MRSLVACLAVAGVAVALAAVPASAGLVTDGLKVRLESSGIVTDGSGNVTSWRDDSGSAHDANATDTTKVPVLSTRTTGTGRPSVFFNGVLVTPTGTATIGQYLKIAGTTDLDMTDGISWYIVYQTNLSDGNRRQIGSGYLDLDPDRTGDQKNYLTWGSTDGVGGTTNTPNTYRSTARAIPVGSSTATMYWANPPSGSTNTTDFYIGGGVWDHAADTITAILVKDTSYRATATAGLVTAVPTKHYYTIIGGAGGSGNEAIQSYFNGSVAAVLIYNRKLTETEQKDVEEYLRTNYLNSKTLGPDLTKDGYVTKADFDLFFGCFSGPMIPSPTTATCIQADFDHDSDVDQVDFGIFQRCYGGESVVPPIECWE